VYIYDLAITNNGPSSYLVGGSFFTMITASNGAYSVAFVSAIQKNLSSVTLNPGQKTLDKSHS